MGLAMVGFQLAVAAPSPRPCCSCRSSSSPPSSAADRTRLRRQQQALRALIESTFTPLAQPRLTASADPFRLRPAPRSRPDRKTP
jgi:hypothetical protein